MPLPWIRLGCASALGLTVAAVAGCKGGKDMPPPPPPPLVTVARPVEYKVQHYLEYNGFLDAVETVQIKARVKGFLKEINFKDREGEEVKEGELLYKIDPREYVASVAKSTADIAKAKADVANAKAQIKLAEAELERYNRAAVSGVSSKSDQDKAAAQLAANQAQLLTANATVESATAQLEMDKLNLEYTTIYSPISGRISRTQVTKGNLVGQNELTLLTTIVRMDPMYVYFDIPERDLVEYQKTFLGKNDSPDAEAKVQVGVATEDGYPHTGKIDFRENRVETGTGTIRIRGEIPNPIIDSANRLLHPGLYARVRIPIGKEEPRPAIPEDALMTGQEGRYVYVIRADNSVEKRKVTVGPQIWAVPPSNAPPKPGWVLKNPKPAEKDKPAPRDILVQSMVAIESGLAVSETIIVNGLQKARPEEKVNPEEWRLLPPPTPSSPGNAEKK